MAIDPVEHIRESTHEIPLALDLPDLVPRVAALRPSLEAPYLTVGIDWRPAGEEPESIPPPQPKRSQRRALRNRLHPYSSRPARTVLERAFKEIIGRYPEHSPAHESLSADIERINTYLNEELEPAAHGVFIVACHRLGVFAPIPLDVPVQTEIKTGNVPALRQLISASEDYPSYAVVVAEQHQADLWLIERLTWERAVELESNDYPRHQKQGGWSQKRYQRRADERVEHFANAIAEQTRQAFQDFNERIRYLVVAADEPMYSALMAEFHETVRNRVIGRIHVEIEAGLAGVIADAEPLVLEAERRREQEAVQAAHDGWAAGGKGVEGAEKTLVALEARQVQTLVMNDDFSQAGWADYTFPLFGVGSPPAEHPAGGDPANIVPTALEDEILRLAIHNDAEVELVWTQAPITRRELQHVPDEDDPKPRMPAAVALDSMGGVGGVLRFALDAGLPTAPLWSDDQQTATGSDVSG